MQFPFSAFSTEEFIRLVSQSSLLVSSIVGALIFWIIAVTIPIDKDAKGRRNKITFWSFVLTVIGFTITLNVTETLRTRKLVEGFGTMFEDLTDDLSRSDFQRLFAKFSEENSRKNGPSSIVARNIVKGWSERLAAGEMAIPELDRFVDELKHYYEHAKSGIVASNVGDIGVYFDNGTYISRNKDLTRKAPIARFYIYTGAFDANDKASDNKEFETYRQRVEDLHRELGLTYSQIILKDELYNSDGIRDLLVTDGAHLAESKLNSDTHDFLYGVVSGNKERTTNAQRYLRALKSHAKEGRVFRMTNSELINRNYETLSNRDVQRARDQFQANPGDANPGEGWDSGTDLAELVVMRLLGE